MRYVALDREVCGAFIRLQLAQLRLAMVPVYEVQEEGPLQKSDALTPPE